MFVCSRSYNCVRILSEREGKKAVSVILPPLCIHSTQRSRFHNINQNLTIRNICTSNKFWANISFNLTDIGEGIREVVVTEWFVKVGDQVSQFDNLCEVQSDKASVTITSRYDGTITKLHHAVDGVAYVGKPLVDIETESTEDSKGEVQEQPPEKNESPLVVENSPKDYKKTLCIPSVRRIAKEHDVNLSEVKGTGKDGRVLKEDILKFLQSAKLQDETPFSEPKEVIHSDRIEKITGFKKVMIKTMTDALKIPHFLYCDEIIVTKLNQIRKAAGTETENKDVKLTLLPFIIKAVSNALHTYPILNASLDSSCENITYKSAHNIGIAMDTPIGLVVPVIKNVDKLNIWEIVKELNRLMKSGKQGSFTPSDLAGGTFTISNIGAIGGTYSAPVILSPQVSIITVGAVKVLPRFDSLNNVVPEEVLNVNASGDHRVIDGATMARFINLVKKQIENPYLLFLHI